MEHVWKMKASLLYESLFYASIRYTDYIDQQNWTFVLS